MSSSIQTVDSTLAEYGGMMDPNGWVEPAEYGGVMDPNGWVEPAGYGGIMDPSG